MFLPAQTAHSRRLCVSTFGKSIDSLKSKVSEARKFHPDLIELRLDYVGNLDSKKLDELEGFLSGNEILTIRSSAEGGRLTISEQGRIDLITYAISRLSPAYFDIEIKTLGKYKDFIQDELTISRTKLIASYHDLSGEKNATELLRISNFHQNHGKSLYATKIVTKARVLEDNLKALSLYSDPKKRALVSFCTGELGIPSRLLCLYLGSPYSYASLPGEAVAPGQLDISTMREIVGSK